VEVSRERTALPLSLLAPETSMHMHMHQHMPYVVPLEVLRYAVLLDALSTA
jgi:hypothetical protein